MKKIAILLIIFLFGWMSNNVYSAMDIIDTTQSEKPNQQFSVLDLIRTVSGPEERISPFDRVSEDQIHVYNDKVILDLQNAEWSSFTDTNSMDPVIDYGSNAIQIIPKTYGEIHVGDIVSYSNENTDGTIIHRVVKIGYDDQGWYAIMKGDNLSSEDPDKVRFSQVKRVLVAIIY